MRVVARARPWAIQDAGYHAIVAPSFADIFRANCYKTGVLAVTLPDRQVRHLIDLATEDPTIEITVDLEAITLVERHANEIGAFEAQRPLWLPSVK